MDFRWTFPKHLQPPCAAARICRVSRICQLSKFPKQLGEGCQLSLAGTPSTRKNGSMVHPKNIPWIFKQTLPGIFHKLFAILTFEFWNLSLSFGISLNETNKGCWDYTKNNPRDFPWRSYFSVLASSSSPLELLEQCCAKARVRWQCQDIPPRGNLSQIRKHHSLRWLAVS